MKVNVSSSCPDITGIVSPKPEGVVIQWEKLNSDQKYDDICLPVGQLLIFSWSNTEHNVEMVDSPAFTKCEGLLKTEGEPGPYTFNATEEGEFYFVCGVGMNNIVFSYLILSRWYLGV